MATPMATTDSGGVHVVLTRFGADVDCLEVQPLTPPTLVETSGDVVVRVRHSCVCGADVNMRMNAYPLMQRAPFTLGYSVAGAIERVGAGAAEQGWSVGDQVVALTITGGQATHVLVPAKHLVRVPTGVDARKAVSLVVDYMTAFQMLHRFANVTPQMHLFVHGASGAVGNAIVQLARLVGCTVSGTASPKNFDALRAMGVTPYDYANHAWVDTINQAGGVDVVFDALGGDSFARSFGVLKPGGLLVGFAMNTTSVRGPAGSANANAAATPEVSQRLGAWVPGLVSGALGLYSLNLRGLFSRRRAGFFALSRDEANFNADLATLLDMVRDGKIDPKIKRSFPVSEIRDAHVFWRSGGGVGSIVVDL